MLHIGAVAERPAARDGVRQHNVDVVFVRCFVLGLTHRALQDGLFGDITRGLCIIIASSNTELNAVLM